MTTGAPALTKLQWQKQLRGADLTHAEYRVLMTISTYTDKLGHSAHPGWTRIIDDARVDRATARRAVRALIAKGWLTLVRKGGNAIGYHVADEYALSLPVVHKGVTGTPLAAIDHPGEGGESHTEGGECHAGKGCEDHPPSDPSSDHHHHSVGQVQRVHSQATEHASWDDLADDMDALEEWLDQAIGGLTAVEYSTAYGMWEDGQHPNAIRNTILASRDPWTAARRTA